MDSRFRGNDGGNGGGGDRPARASGMRRSDGAGKRMSRNEVQPKQSANEIDARRAAARRTALILGAVALLLFVLSIVQVLLEK
jgi:hypothetical protein